MINIFDFETQVNSTILKRGKQYYDNNFVKNLIKTDDESFEANVSGTNVYKVNVQINSLNQIRSSCTCPFDFGPICKHEVAVFYRLREVIEQGALIGNSEELKSSDDWTLVEILNALSKEELIQFLMKQTANDPSLESHLRFRYGQRTPEEELIESKRLLQAIDEKYIDYKGHLHTGISVDYALEMDQVLNKTAVIKNPLIACDIAFLVMTQLLKLLEYFEDDDWTLGEVVDDCIRTVKSISTSEINSEEKKKLFKRIIEELDHDEVPVWEDFQENLFEILDTLAEEENIFETYVEELMNRVTEGNTWSTKYHNERYLNKVFNLIEKRGDIDEQMLFLVNNIDYESFREKLINYYFNQQDYAQVVQLALDGEKLDKQYSGKVIKWKELRYKAYKYADRINDQVKLGEELILSGKYEYYEELSAVLKDGKQKFYEELKVKLKNDFAFHRSSSIYLQLIKKEQDLPAIAEVVLNDVRYVRDFADYLKDTHKDLLMRAYKHLIEHEASIAANRSGYKEVAALIEECKENIDENLAKEITHRISVRYSRKTAFMDELNKAGLLREV